MKLVGAYRFRTASAYGRVTLTSHQRGVANNKPRSIPASALPEVYRLSSEVSGHYSKIVLCPHNDIKYLPQMVLEQPRIDGCQQHVVYVDGYGEVITMFTYISFRT